MVEPSGLIQVILTPPSGDPCLRLPPPDPPSPHPSIHRDWEGRRQLLRVDVEVDGLDPGGGGSGMGISGGATW